MMLDLYRKLLYGGELGLMMGVNIKPDRDITTSDGLNAIP